MQVVNDKFFNHVRSENCVYVRGDILRLTRTVVGVKIREQVERGSTLPNFVLVVCVSVT